MLNRLAPPDSVRLVTDVLISRITAAAGGPNVIEQLPSSPPSLARGAVVFHERCAQCHGETGRGDGPKAKTLKGPPPADLTDPKVMHGTTLLEIFRRIAIGVTGHFAMPEFAEICRTKTAGRSRPTWSDAVRRIGHGCDLCRGPPAGRLGDRPALREDRVRRLSHVRAGRTEVRAKNAGLAGELETTFAWLRTRAARADDAERHSIRERLLAGLERAERVVADRPSSMSLFVASFFLLVREGFEASSSSRR